MWNFYIICLFVALFVSSLCAVCSDITQQNNLTKEDVTVPSSDDVVILPVNSNDTRYSSMPSIMDALLLLNVDDEVDATINNIGRFFMTDEQVYHANTTVVRYILSMSTSSLSDSRVMPCQNDPNRSGSSGRSAHSDSFSSSSNKMMLRHTHRHISATNSVLKECRCRRHWKLFRNIDNNVSENVFLDGIDYEPIIGKLDDIVTCMQCGDERIKLNAIKWIRGAVNQLTPLLEDLGGTKDIMGNLTESVYSVLAGKYLCHCPYDTFFCS
jgi:hypothetical protein